jgi:hypothetical protein
MLIGIDLSEESSQKHLGEGRGYKREWWRG